MEKTAEDNEVHVLLLFFLNSSGIYYMKKFKKLYIENIDIASRSYNLAWAARVAQCLERRRKDLVILASPVRIPLWDVGAVSQLSVAQKRTLTAKSAKHRSEFAAPSPVMVTAAG